MSPGKTSRAKTPPPPAVSSSGRKSAKTPATPPKLDKKDVREGGGGKKKKVGGGGGGAGPPRRSGVKKVPRVRKMKLGKTPRETREKVKEVRRRLAIKNALRSQKKVFKSGDNEKSRVRKIRTTVHFRRPRTFRPPRNPKFPRKAVPKRNKMDIWSVIEYPLATEAAMKKIEDQNTMVFICHPRATKIHIRAATKKLLNVEIVKVNTLVTPKGKKKAFVRLSKDFDALDQANRMGII